MSETRLDLLAGGIKEPDDKILDDFSSCGVCENDGRDPGCVCVSLCEAKVSVED